MLVGVVVVFRIVFLLLLLLYGDDDDVHIDADDAWDDDKTSLSWSSSSWSSSSSSSEEYDVLPPMHVQSSSASRHDSHKLNNMVDATMERIERIGGSSFVAVTAVEQLLVV
jgi:hypothetical protein